MTTTKALLIVGLGAMAILASTASGGAPMGPPMAMLGEGQWAVGAEYGREQIDLRGCGMFNTVFDLEGPEPYDFVESQSIRDLEMNMFFGTLAYGVCDNWDVFVRLGAADAQDEAVATADVADFGIPADYPIGNIDGSYGFAWGVGTRATFCRWGPWSFGGLVQATWFEPGDSDITYLDQIVPPGGQGVHVGEASLDFMQAQVALAAIYQMDTWHFWGGPFLQFIDGDLDRDGAIVFDRSTVGVFSASAEIKEESQFGAHFGANWALAEQWNVWAEGQVTGDSWLVSIGAIFVPQEAGGM